MGIAVDYLIKNSVKRRFGENLALCFSTVLGPMEASSCLEVNVNSLHVSSLASCASIPPTRYCNPPHHHTHKHTPIRLPDHFFPFSSIQSCKKLNTLSQTFSQRLWSTALLHIMKTSILSSH